MRECYFENDAVKIFEKKTIMSEGYDIQNEMLVSSKNINVVTESSIYTYEDKYKLYLKIDESKLPTMISIMVGCPNVATENCLITVADTSSFWVKRIAKNNFLVIVKDEYNEDSRIGFVKFNEDYKLESTILNCTTVVSYEIVLDKWVIVNTTEAIDCGKNLNYIAVYNFDGKLKETVFDEKSDKNVQFSFKMLNKSENKNLVFIFKQQGKRTSQIKRVLLTNENGG